MSIARSAEKTSRRRGALPFPVTRRALIAKKGKSANLNTLSKKVILARIITDGQGVKLSASTVQSSLEIMDVLSKIVVPLLVAAFAAFFSARFALNKFYKEKWWEKRLDAFTDIINLAYRLKMANDYFLNCEYAKRGNDEEDFKPHPKGIEDQLKSEYWIDQQNIERIAQLADFTLTANTRTILEDYLAAREKIVQDWHDDAIDSLEGSERDYALSKQLLEKLVTEAKKELKIKA